MTMQKRNGGFSLVEILIALALLGFGMVTLFNLFPLGLQSLSYSHRLNEVSLLAQKKLEELKARKPIPLGVTAGKEGEVSWSISASKATLAPGIDATLVQLDIDFNFQKASQRQSFVTYLPND